MTQENDNFGKRGQRQPQPWLRYLVLTPFAVGAAVLAAFFFTAVIALLLLAAAVFGVRIWWLRRKLRAGAGGAHGGRDQPLEGEYKVISDDEVASKDEEQRRFRR